VKPNQGRSRVHRLRERASGRNQYGIGNATMWQASCDGEVQVYLDGISGSFKDNRIRFSMIKPE
jgi:hypothetical protein